MRIAGADSAPASLMTWFFQMGPRSSHATLTHGLSCEVRLTQVDNWGLRVLAPAFQ